MLVKEENGKINFIDKNDAFVGFDSESSCCEQFGWYVSDHLTENEPEEDLPLEGYWFDTGVDHAEVEGYWEEGGCVAFKLVNGSGDVRYLHLYNHHNGYYSHGWEASWGCEGYL